MTEKLKPFIDAIHAAANAQIATAEAKIGSDTAALEAQAEKKAQTAAAEWKKSQAEQLRAAALQELTAHQGEGHRARLARREQYAAEVFAAVREKIAAYTRSDAYGQKLAELLAKAQDALGDGQTVIWLRREDMAFGDALRKKCPNSEVREGDFALGGLCLSVDSRRADLSLDTALDSMRGRFAEIIGMEIEP